MPLDICPECGADRANGLCPRCVAKPALEDDPPGPDRSAEADPETTLATNAGPDVPKSDPTGELILGATDRTIDHSTRHEATDQSGTVDGRNDRLFRAATVRYFGDYEIEKELGRGGMGVVYKARQVSLNRAVALKLIKAGVLADAAELRRFQNEAEAVALLDHKGIVPVYEIGEHEGQRYFSMKLVDGGNLAEQLPTFKTNPRAAATLLAETAEAVRHAHMRGILHRDLKPANILIDAEGHPHVTDFGLAKRVEGDAEVTLSGAIIGTPAYMSPEQANGRRGSITTATDVYGLGAILYALLTGKAPFGGDSVDETLDAVRNRPPESPRKFNAHVPHDLETICLKCLDKDPRRRYASAHELADDLNNWHDSRPITARRVGATERAWLWCKRKPAIAALAAAVAVAAVGGAGAVIAVQTTANRLLEKKNVDLLASNTELDKQRVRAEDREARAIDAVKRFGDAVANEPALKNAPALDALRKRLLKEPLVFFRALRDRLQADRDTRPESLTRLAAAGFDLGQLSDEIGDKQDALIAYRESLAIRKKLADANPEVTELQAGLAKCYNNIGLLLSDTGQSAEALRVHESALAISQKLADADPGVTEFQAGLARSHHNIGILLGAIGKPVEALRAGESALAISQKLTDANPEVTEFQAGLAKNYNNIGNLLVATGKPVEALKACGSALAIWQKLADANPEVTEFQRHLAASHGGIALLLSATGRTDEAMQAHGSALAISRKLADANPAVAVFQADLARIHNNVGVLLSVTGKPAEALGAHESALAIWTRLADANPEVTEHQSSLASSLGNVANMLGVTGKADEAMRAHGSAMAIQRRLAREHSESPEFASNLGATLNNMAMLDLDAKRFGEARVRLQEAVEWQRKALASNPAHPTYRQFLALHLENLIGAARGLGDPEGVANAERELAKLRDSDPEIVALDARLSSILGGEAPKSNTERLAIARRAYEKSLPAAAAKLWDDALDADPKLAEDRRAQTRYNAACAASLAAAGRGNDVPPPDDAAKTKLRRQALDWLNAELSAWKRVSMIIEPGNNETVAKTLSHWKVDTDLGVIRDVESLVKLPEAERAALRSFWADVEALRKRAEAKVTPAGTK
jgi:tetratricopeptide (TPR) repeat protein/tRNA A-37 threonylcarbamoyl transferase component Bud32